MSGVSFITAHVAYVSTNKNQNRLNREGTLFLLNPGRTRLMFTCVLGCRVAASLTSDPHTLGRALTASVDSCAEINNVPSVAQPVLAESGGRCRKAILGV